MCRSALSARSPSAHGLPGRFAPDAPLQTASVYVKIVLDTQNCILFCVFKIFIWDFCAKSIFDVCWILPSLLLRGAWIEISTWTSWCARSTSLLLRGAWIEMAHPLCGKRFRWVAPLAGSVDRNSPAGSRLRGACRSLLLRGAWIEMASASTSWPATRVAPLAGSVDRNPLVIIRRLVLLGRSSCGERG